MQDIFPLSHPWHLPLPPPLPQDVVSFPDLEEGEVLVGGHPSGDLTYSSGQADVQTYQ